MADPRSLKGACCCGRIRYTVLIPSEIPEDNSSSNGEQLRPQVTFSISPHDRRTQATPLAAWLRVPLTWYSSTTHAYASDETHTTIRRTYIPATREAERRCFCAHCGTHLSRWTDDPPQESEWIAVTLGSLDRQNLDELEEMGLLPGSTASEEPGPESLSPMRISDQAGSLDTWPWFESFVSGSGLGKLTRTTGSSSKGGQTLEWEVVEWVDDSEERQATPGKRKRLKGDEGEDNQ